MFRIDDPSAATSMPTPEAAGTPGYWTEGNPTTGVPATLERASWFNSIQEELMSIVAAGGVTPSKTSFNQVLAAIQALIAPTGIGQFASSKGSAGYQKLPSGLIIQWGVTGASGNSSGATVTFPIAFPNTCLSVTGSDAGNQIYSYGADTFTASTFKLYGGNWANGSINYTTGACRWIAIGY